MPPTNRISITPGTKKLEIKIDSYCDDCNIALKAFHSVFKNRENIYAEFREQNTFRLTPDISGSYWHIEKIEKTDL